MRYAFHSHMEVNPDGIKEKIRECGICKMERKECEKQEKKESEHQKGSSRNRLVKQKDGYQRL